MTFGSESGLLNRRKGSALVIVLSSLAFLAALALAFLSSVGTELKSSKGYLNDVGTKLLAQSTYNLAAVQIMDGTKGVDGSGRLLAWASQPGMIRTYTSAGGKSDFFRLYSWDVLKESGDVDVSGEIRELENWDKSPALFTDLNEPIKVAQTKVYPIVDGNNLDTVSGVPGLTYKKDSVQEIEGFYVNGIPSASISSNPVPMPVKWLYVLQDGKIVAAEAGSKADEAKVSQADNDNPIVGRIAFWTDDETCKININTASEGTYWDTPRTSSKYDGQLATAGNLANFQPAQNEYQRYPGHPAMTSLSTVFKAPAGMSATNWRETLYSIVPRIKGGPSSSMGGTVNVTSATPPAPLGSPDDDRLYSSVDELIFTTTSTAGVRNENKDSNSVPVFTKDYLERAKFFVTASSKAPDVNLYNKPRVSVWPAFQKSGDAVEDAKRRTAFDNLMAFVSTLNGYPFYFQRSNPSSPTADLPSIPYNIADTDVKRNRHVLEYLRNLTHENIPGFGGNFAAKYPADRDQILTEIFDYIRSTNTADTTVEKPFTWTSGTSKNGQVVPIEDSTTNTRGFGRFPTLQGVTFLFYGSADSASRPPNETTNPPAGQIRVYAIIVPQLFDPSQGYPCVSPKFRIEISGLSSLFVTDDSGVVTTAGVAAQKLFNSDTGTTGPPSYINMTQVDQGYGGLIGAFETLAENTSFPWKSVSLVMKNPEPPGDPVVSPPPTFTLSPGKLTLKFMPASPDNTVLQTIELDIPEGKFPVPSVAPVIGTTDSRDFRMLGTHGSGDNKTYGRNYATGQAHYRNWITSKDVAFSIVPAGGDMRLIAARKTILSTDANYSKMYGKHSKWAAPGVLSERYAHNLRNGINDPYKGATGGRLMPLDYRNYKAQYDIEGTTTDGTQPKKYPRDSALVPDTFTNGVFLGETDPSVSGGVQADWDNGFSETVDGPYINKADEGDLGKNGVSGERTPYYSTQYKEITESIFSPCRMIPSPGVFGSLPTGVASYRPWQTLLFHPDPAGTHPGNKGRKGDGSIGAGMPADYLLLDLFNMPVAEPYAISEPMATSGRINMNYQIMPFIYINRDTGIRAVLKAEKVIAIPESNINDYKTYGSGPGLNTNANFRFTVDAGETLEGFKNKFAANEIFVSAAEICSLPIVPTGATRSQLLDAGGYWATRRLTGDNSKERPYTTIYPRLTTKSNTFTVYVRVQALKKIKDGNPTIWTEGKDLVTGEYRGSQTIERYLNFADSSIPDYADPTETPPIANPTETKPISNFYKIRITSSKEFAP